MPRGKINLQKGLVVLRRVKLAWGGLSKIRKAIVVAIAVAAVMVSSSLLNHGKTDAASNNVATMVCNIVVLLMWAFYQLLRRLVLMLGLHSLSRRLPGILLALAFSVTLNGLACMAIAKQHPSTHVWASVLVPMVLLAPIGFLMWLFGHIFSDEDFGNWVGLLFGWLFSIAFWAVGAWKVMNALGSLKKRSERETPSPEPPLGSD